MPTPRQDVLNVLLTHIATLPPPPPKEEAPIPDIMAAPDPTRVRISEETINVEPEPVEDQVYLGRRVAYRLKDGACAGEWRAADVIRVWDVASGVVNLHVLLDYNNDPGSNPWAKSVTQGYEPGNWTWIDDPAVGS